MVTCEQVHPLLPDHALGTLAETEAAGVRRHLRGCATCRTEAAGLDQGVALFASAAHSADPPAELEARVMSVLAEEWSEGRPEPARPRGFRVRLPAIAVASVVAVGLVAWAAAGQLAARSYRGDAQAYEEILETLGGIEFRVASLRPAGASPVRGSAMVYDSATQQSWAGVLVRAPGYTGEIMVTLSGSSGPPIELFPITVEDGLGDTWLATDEDLTGYDTIRLTTRDGRLLATSTITSDH